MFDIIESDHKKFKHENVGRSKDLENKIDELAFENCSLKEKTSELEKQCADLQVTFFISFESAFKVSLTKLIQSLLSSVSSQEFISSSFLNFVLFLFVQYWFWQE